MLGGDPACVGTLVTLGMSAQPIFAPCNGGASGVVGAPWTPWGRGHQTYHCTAARHSGMVGLIEISSEPLRVGTAYVVSADVGEADICAAQRPIADVIPRGMLGFSVVMMHRGYTTPTTGPLHHPYHCTAARHNGAALGIPVAGEGSRGTDQVEGEGGAAGGRQPAG